MHDSPSVQELVDAVKGFLDGVAMKELTGHARFNARVASNVLAIVLRELEQRPAAENEEAKRLRALLGKEQNEEDLEALEATLIDKLRSGEIDQTNPELLAHLKATAIAQLNVDQPSYSGLKDLMADRKISEDGDT